MMLLPNRILPGVVALNERQRKHLRGLGHALHALVQVADKGVTPAVIAELDRALGDHELVKVRIRLADRDARSQAIEALAAATDSVEVTRIGHVALYYRPHPKVRRIILPA
jgi:RNA-binding protein